MNGQEKIVGLNSLRLFWEAAVADVTTKPIAETERTGRSKGTLLTNPISLFTSLLLQCQGCRDRKWRSVLTLGRNTLESDREEIPVVFLRLRLRSYMKALWLIKKRDIPSTRHHLTSCYEVSLSSCDLEA